MLNSEKNFGKVGAFEGAAYEAKGLYRPELDCIMFTTNNVPFCKVCHEAKFILIKKYRLLIVNAIETQYQLFNKISVVITNV